VIIVSNVKENNFFNIMIYLKLIKMKIHCLISIINSAKIEKI